MVQLYSEVRILIHCMAYSREYFVMNRVNPFLSFIQCPNARNASNVVRAKRVSKSFPNPWSQT
jgi:hypothetical protein